MPQTKDKSTLKDFDLNFTYTVGPAEVSYFYTQYSATAHLKHKEHEEIFPMGAFVTAIVRAAAYSAVAEFDALEVNNNRVKIEQRVAEIANAKLKHEKLEGKIAVAMVNVKNIQLADTVIDSANRAVNAQNDLLTKKTEVQIATQEGLRIKALAEQSKPEYIQLLQAQATMKTSEALYEAAKNKSNVWVVPNNFVALGGMSSAVAPVAPVPPATKK